MFALCALAVFASAPAAAAAPGLPLAARNQGLKSVTTLAPWLSSPVAFRDPKHRQAIGRSLEILAHLQHPFFHEPGSSSTGVGTLFGAQATRAQREFKQGETEAARFRVQGLTQLCLACHLREPNRDFVDPASALEGVQLTPLQRAQYFATTRQFELALDLWRTELERPVELEADQFGQLETLRLALRVAVRVKDDARLAQRLIAPLLERATLPGFALRDLQSWQQAAAAWQEEHFVLTERTPTALVGRARALVAFTGAASHAGAMSQHYVSLLRAASYLDEAMRQDPQGAYRGEALYLLGVVHASISESALWRLEWMYFEACIRENPASSRAVSCAERLEQRTWFVWRSGADMPVATQGALKELRALASPRPPTQ